MTDGPDQITFELKSFADGNELVTKEVILAISLADFPEARPYEQKIALTYR